MSPQLAFDFANFFPNWCRMEAFCINGLRRGFPTVETRMTAKISTNMMPVQRERERAGQHLLFMAGVRSKLAKKGGDALGSLAHGDVERDGRYPAPAEIGTGGELVPSVPELRDTVTNPDYVAVDASRDRLALANLAGVFELALNASDTVAPKNGCVHMLLGSTKSSHPAARAFSSPPPSVVVRGMGGDPEVPGGRPRK